MKPDNPTYIALTASIPIALLVLWWVYRKRASQQTSDTHRDEETTAPVCTQDVATLNADTQDDNLTKPENSQIELLAIVKDSAEQVSLVHSPASSGTIERNLSSSDAGFDEEGYQDGKVNSSLIFDAGADNNNEEIPQQNVMSNKDIEGENIKSAQEKVLDTAIFVGSTGACPVVSEETQDGITKGEKVEIAPTDSFVFAGDASNVTGLESLDTTSEKIFVNIAGAGDAPIEREANTETSKLVEKEASFQQYFDEMLLTQNHDSIDETTGLLDTAITDSIQLHATDTECEESQASELETGLTSTRSSELPMTESECEPEASEQASELETGSKSTQSSELPMTKSESEPEASEQTSEREIGLTSTQSSELPMAKSDCEPEASEGSNLEMASEVEKDTHSPSSLSSTESHGDESTDLHEGNDEDVINIHSSDKEEDSEKTGAQEECPKTQEEMPNVNNNNNHSSENEGANSSNSKIVNHVSLNSEPIISQSDIRNIGTLPEDSQKIDDGELESYNSNGFANHEPSMHNGHPPEEYENGTQIYLEFPSDKVGLLIGKMGRNIRNLKLESGAEIMVHTVPYRDDIQVLRIVGSSTSVDLAASLIQKRFREVSLKEFDSANMGGPFSPSMMSSPGVMSPLESPISPPTFAYPVPDMSQLRLPEGIPVEVIVSAISDCDSVFLQQYTHPTYHALASLEHAMSMCYSSPSTPALLSPVQVGLVCVAQHGDIWYRAQVIHANEGSNEITIKFVDYGGYSTVPIDTVKQIRADFITLPFQAAECYLDNIAPPDGEESYSIESTTVLQDLLKEGEFHARITRYRGDGHPLIRLYKRHGGVTELVNELLEAKGVAKWIDFDPDCPDVSSA